MSGTAPVLLARPVPFTDASLVLAPPTAVKYFSFPTQRIVLVGCGAIGQGTLPLLFRHFDIQPAQVWVVTADCRGRDEAAACGVPAAQFVVQALTPDNYVSVLTPLLDRGGFLVNLSVEVSSAALIRLSQQTGTLYIDTCSEPWKGEYNDPALSASERSNYAQRQDMLNLRTELGRSGHANGPTAVLTHGANPGMISHLVKHALVTLARDAAADAGKPAPPVPHSRADWAALARQTGVKVIHVAERDTQLATAEAARKPGEFVNTWSVDGFISEGLYQPSELGWGSHEKALPRDGHEHHLAKGNGVAAPSIYLDHHGGDTRVRTWTPLGGTFAGFLVTHAEAISIPAYLTVVNPDTHRLLYRPTVHYAYHPCDYACMSVFDMMGNNYVEPESDMKRVLRASEIVSGMDELGALLMGHKRNSFWFGSQLTTDSARELAPFNTATTLQVTSAVIGGMVWALLNPEAGIVEPDEMDYQTVLGVCWPYWMPLVGAYSDFTPLNGRSPMDMSASDTSDPWQFTNFRIH